MSVHYLTDLEREKESRVYEIVEYGREQIFLVGRPTLTRTFSNCLFAEAIRRFPFLSSNEVSEIANSALRIIYSERGWRI